MCLNGMGVMCLCLWMIAHMFGADGSAMLSARASLVRLVVHRSSVCSCIARLPFVCRYSARDMGARASDRLSDRLSDRASLVCLIVHRSCIARLSARASLVCLIVCLLVHRSSV